MALTQQAQNDIALGAGGSYSLARDAIKHTLWDTRYLGTTISNFTFFSIPVGGTWRNAGLKTINETNLYNSGTLPNGQTFLAKRIGVSLIVPISSSSTDTPFVVQAYNNLMQSSVWELKLQGREFDFQCHGRQFLPTVAVSGANATNAPYRTGECVCSGWISLEGYPIFLDELVSFNVAMTLSNPTTSVVTQLNADASKLNGLYASIQCSIEGALTRAK